MKQFARSLFLAGACSLSGLADAAPMGHLDSGNTAWMLTSTALVLMMTLPGLALFYGGMVRRKNVLSVLMQQFAITCLVAVLWVVAGYSLAFTPGTPLLGGTSRFMLAGLGVDSLSGASPGNVPETVFMMFQMTFAIITPGLIFGAVAERMKFSAALLYAGLWSLVVYAPVAHWVWGPDGWLAARGMLDYAGGSVVHINSGFSALVAAILLGKRLGYGKEPMAPHNMVLTLIGGALLWVGWFGFNAGSAVAADGHAGMAMATTMIATAAAALTWMAVEWLSEGKPSLLGIVSGAVAGLVVITPACGFVAPGGALAMGAIGGAFCFWTATRLKKLLKVDDSLDAFGVHGMGGVLGALLTGVFAVKAIGGTAGLLEGNSAILAVQAMGVGATIIWTMVASFVLLKLIDGVIGLHVSEDEEREGLDIALHGERVE